MSESALGGARFTVTIPHVRLTTSAAAPASALDTTMLDGVIEELRFATPSARRGDSPAAFDAAAGGRPRVLVVEDNPDMNRFIVAVPVETSTTWCRRSTAARGSRRRCSFARR